MQQPAVTDLLQLFSMIACLFLRLQFISWFISYFLSCSNAHMFLCNVFFWRIHSIFYGNIACQINVITIAYIKCDSGDAFCIFSAFTLDGGAVTIYFSWNTSPCYGTMWRVMTLLQGNVVVMFITIGPREAIGQ